MGGCACRTGREHRPNEDCQPSRRGVPHFLTVAQPQDSTTCPPAPVGFPLRGLPWCGMKLPLCLVSPGNDECSLWCLLFSNFSSSAPKMLQYMLLPSPRRQSLRAILTNFMGSPEVTEEGLNHASPSAHHPVKMPP